MTHPAAPTPPAAALGFLTRLRLGAELVYLRWRMRSARDECADLLQVWDWIPHQLEHHKRQILRWDRRVIRLQMQLFGMKPADATTETTLPASDFAGLR